jgi:hypothetical protein
MKFSAPPPGLTVAGPIPELTAALSAHVAAENRRSWSAPCASLVLGPDGLFGTRAWPLAPFEEGGFRAVLVHFNDSFPRATPCLRQLPEATMATVWGDLFRPPAGDVRVFERTGPDGPQVWAAAPVSWPPDFGVDELVAGVSALLPSAPVGLLEYDAAESTVVLLVDFGPFNVRVSGTDRYDAGGVSVSVVTKDGVDLGDPLPGVRRRRREGGDTVLDGVAEKLRAASAFYTNEQTR